MGAGGRGPKFPADTDGFLRELRRRAADHFATADGEQGDGRMYLKAVAILGWTAAAYGLLVFAATAWWQAVPLAVALGLGLAAVAFNLAHDGGHSAVSRRRWVNRLAAGTLDLVGASSYLWRLKHGIHHTYANVPGHDTDIDLGRLMRLCPTQPRHWFHRWQHLYLWPLYGLSAARWHLYSDFQEVAAGRIGPHPIRRPRGWDLAVFVGGKAVSIGLLLGLPLALHPWWVVLPGYLLVMGVLGVTTCSVFQLAHCVGEADFPVPAGDPSPAMADCWAVHQVRTTVDFARGSRGLTWLLGGLNYQIEHHLFPRVCHVHYPALAAVVEATCREYGVRYSAHPTLRAGLVAHYRWLKEMGRPVPVG
ncbi:MAG: acyl-CoA desaturase [Gemmataceae bacterium]